MAAEVGRHESGDSLEGSRQGQRWLAGIACMHSSGDALPATLSVLHLSPPAPRSRRWAAAAVALCPQTPPACPPRPPPAAAPGLCSRSLPAQLITTRFGAEAGFAVVQKQQPEPQQRACPARLPARLPTCPRALRSLKNTIVASMPRRTGSSRSARACSSGQSARSLWQQ